MLPSLQQVNVYNNYYGRFFYLELLIWSLTLCVINMTNILHYAKNRLT